MAKKKPAQVLQLPTYNQTNVVGLDLSLTATGWFKLASGLMTYGVLPEQKLREHERLDWILKELTIFPTRNTLYVLEDIAPGAKGSAVHQMAGLAYLVRHSLWLLDVPFVLVTPSQLKKFVTGKGNVEKSVVIKEVYKRFSIDTDNDNTADAVVLGHIGMSLTGAYIPTTADQRAMLTDIRKRHAVLVPAVAA